MTHLGTHARQRERFPWGAATILATVWLPAAWYALAALGKLL